MVQRYQTMDNPTREVELSRSGHDGAVDKLRFFAEGWRVQTFAGIYMFSGWHVLQGFLPACSAAQWLLYTIL